MNLPTENQVNAALRHVGTATASAASVFVVLGFLSPEQAQAVIADMQQIVDGLQQVFGGFSKLLIVIGPVFATVMAGFAAKSGGAANLVASVLKIATGPASPAAAEAQKAIVQATVAIAKDSSIPQSGAAAQALADVVVKGA
jgi:hypothetical protein